MQDHTTTVIESQLDWITCTCPADARVDALRVLAGQLLQTQEDAGNQRHDWLWHGYHGEKCGAITWGVGDQGGFLQASGPEAARSGERMYRITHHVSRIDLQVTVRYPELTQGIARFGYQMAKQHETGKANPRKTYFIEGSDGGSTLYLGSPQSDQRARLYDKAIESQSDHYADCWRYEVQYRHDYANDVAVRLFGVGDRGVLIAGNVLLFFSKCGIAVPWRFQDGSLPIVERGERHDIERKLAWLATQVRPTVEWLCKNAAGDRAAAVLGSTGWTFVDLEVASDL